MEKSLFAPLLRAAWRRRHLIAMPLLILLPLSLLVAWMMPRQYQATALVMMPESTGFGTNQQGYGYSHEMAAKMKGLEALLKSDYVLVDVLGRAYKEDAGKAPLQERVEDLRKRINAKQVSDNFVQISLADKEKEGLGQKLSIVLAALFEGLLSPTNSSNDAVSFVTRQRQAEIQAIERKIKELEAQQPKFTEGMVREHANAGTSAAERVVAKQNLLNSDRVKLQAEIERILGPAMPLPKDRKAGQPEGLLPQVIAERSAALDALVQKGQGGTQAASGIAQQIERLRNLSTQQIEMAELAREIDAEQSVVAAQQSATRDLVTLLQQRRQLYDEIDHAKSRHQQLLERLRGSGGVAALNLLRAPAQVQVVDLPTDPTRPSNSRLRILLISVVASLAFCVALVALAEQLDPKLRSPDHLEALTQLPIIARLDTWPASTSPDDDEARRYRRDPPSLRPVDGTSVTRQLRS